MKPEYMIFLINDEGRVVAKSKAFPLKKDAEAFLKELDTQIAYEYARIDPVYLKGGEAVGR